MYAAVNFKSVEEFKLAVESGELVRLVGTDAGNRGPPLNGRAFVKGPHYSDPHEWCAAVTVENGYVKTVE